MQIQLVRGIVGNVLSSRPELYALPGLSEVNGNGGDKINKQAQRMLRELAKQFAPGEDIVGEMVRSSPGKRKAGKVKSDGDEPTTPTKKPRASAKKAVKEKDVKPDVVDELESEEGSP